MEPIGFFEEFRELSQLSRFRASEPFLQGHVELSNPVCGDLVQLKLEVVGDRLTRFRYRFQGCWPVQGCLELLGGLVEGQNVETALGLRFQNFLEAVQGIPASKRHAFSLVHRVFFLAISETVGGDGKERLY